MQFQFMMYGRFSELENGMEKKRQLSKYKQKAALERGQFQTDEYRLSEIQS